MSRLRGILRPFGFALVLAMGFAIVFGLAAGWGLSIWESLGSRATGSVNESLIVRADGTPLIQRITYDGYTNRNDYRTLDGKEVASPGLLATSAPLRFSRFGKMMFPLSGKNRMRIFFDQQTPICWYFVDDGEIDGRGYFAGYDSRTKHRVGFIGRNGLRGDQPPAEDWFPMDGEKLANYTAFASPLLPNYYDSQAHSAPNLGGESPDWKVDMISGGQLVQIDLRKGTVTTLMESPDLRAIAILPLVGPEVGETPRKAVLYRGEYLAVRTVDRVVLLDGAGKQHVAYVIPEEFRDLDFDFYELGKNEALLKTGDYGKELTSIDTAGKVVRREKAVLLNNSGPSVQQEAWAASIAVPSPVALFLFAAVFKPLELWTAGNLNSYSAIVSANLKLFALPLLAVLLLSTVLGWVCWRHYRRFYRPGAELWFVFVLLTGPAGLVGYFFHTRWPVREACPACGRVVPRDRETCAACGAEFPAPQPKGIEVFA